MQLVEHINYGKGKIQKKRFGGFELYVEFEDGIKKWVRRDEVRFLSKTSILIKHKLSELKFFKEQFKARQIIEALRLGIVPYKYVEEFTFGREDEIKQIKNWLNNPSVGSLAIVGEYGVGKTHLLEHIYFSALSNNWAVSIVELDPNETSFHKPKIIYQKIISSFRFKSQSGDFREFLKEIALSTKDKNIGKYCSHEKFKIKEYNENGNLIYCPLYDIIIREGADLCKKCKYYYLNKNSVTLHIGYGLKEHIYLGRIIEKIRNGIDDEYVWEWIEGKSMAYNYPQMHSYSTCANIYCYILSGIGWAAKNMLGLNGFLILFDEGENVDSYWYTYYQNNKVWNFLKGIILMANNDRRLIKEVSEKNFYEHHAYGGWWGYETDLQYCGYKRLPFIWRIPCNVKIIFAFTPIPWILDREPLDSLNKIELEHIDNESLMKISETIINLYQKAYNFQPSENPLDLIPKDKTRLFIKGMIEALDLMRFHSDKSIEELLK